jgi:cytochrome c oxidase subunit 3
MNSGTKVERVAPHALARHGETVDLGMWAFLATEMLFFGSLIVAYTLYRFAYPAVFRAGAHEMEFGLGTINTAVLLISSVFMALADRAVRAGKVRLGTGLLVATGMLGAVFLGIKAFEYHSKAVDHLIPGAHFRPGGPPQLQLFFSLYFAMTGLHAIHMILGLGAVTWLIVRLRRGTLSPSNAEPLAAIGLYWHFVDCIWVVLYPLFYLPGR